MGSSPSKQNKVLIGVQQIKTPQTQTKQNLQFRTSVQQMKFSKRSDIFKQKSQQTKMQLNHALQNLKKNQLLSTGQFKKLHKTQQLINNQNKKLSTNTKPQKQQKKQRYQYKNNKYSQQNLSVKYKKSQDVKNISSASSTYINQGKQTIDLTESNSPKYLEAQVISHILNRKKHITSQTSNKKYKNILDTDNAQFMEQNQINYQNGKNNNKKKAKYIKSQKFIPHQLTHNLDQQVPQYSFDKQSGNNS